MSENSPVKISIVIPVKNGASTIESCLQGIMKQTLFNYCEIIVIDSGSTDGTLEIIKKYPVQLYQIPSEEFNHGATRNYGVSLSNGEFVVLTVQDAIPVGSQWLETMLKHFDDSLVAGVCGQQIVPHHKDKNPHKWFRPQNEASISIIYKHNQPHDYRPRGWDDVNAMYRKDSLLKIPFQPVDFGEDFLWAYEAYNAGYKLVLDTNSRVEHYHHARAHYVYTRTITELYFEYQHYKTIATYNLRLKELLLIIYRNLKYKAHPKWIWHNWTINFLKYKAWKEVKVAIKRNKIEQFYKVKIKDIPQGRVLNTYK